MPTPTHPPTQDGEESPKPLAKALTVNQVVAHNLARARRAKGWTQAKAAERLSEMTGANWSAATLGAAERSYDGGRKREFNANELVAFSLVFDQSVSFFFVPPDLGEREVVCFMDSRIASERPGTRIIGFGVSELEMLEKAVPLRQSAQVVDDVNRVLLKRKVHWDPGSARLDWRFENEWFEEEEDQVGDDAWQTEPTSTESAKQREIDRLRAIARRRAKARLRPEEGDLTAVLRRAADFLEEIGREGDEGEEDSRSRWGDPPS